MVAVKDTAPSSFRSQGAYTGFFLFIVWRLVEGLKIDVSLAFALYVGGLTPM